MSEEKILEIKIGTLEQFEKETLKDLAKVEKGEEGSDTVFFENPSMFRKVLTEKRQELVQEVMENPPESIRGLAERLDRGVREVYEDVHLLKRYKLLTLKEEKNRKKPRIPYDMIHMEIDLPVDRRRSTAIS